MSAELLSRAIKIAAECHAGQLDKSGDPYILHPIRVMQRCQGNFDVMIVAIQHDTVEDTPLNLEDLRSLGFLDVHIEAIDAMTRRIIIPGGRKELYIREFIQRVKKNPIAAYVKYYADIGDNTLPERTSKLAPEERKFLAKRYARAEEELKEAAEAAKEALYG